jgi:CBS domain-containing protein
MNRKLKDLFDMRKNVIHSVSSDTTIKDAVDLMNKNHIGALMIIDSGEIKGICSERDVMIKLASTDDLVGHLPVKEIMTPKEKLIFSDGEQTLEEIMRMMTDKHIRHLPIMENDRLAGVISIRDIIRMLLRDARTKSEQLTNYIEGKYPR